MADAADSVNRRRPPPHRSPEKINPTPTPEWRLPLIIVAGHLTVDPDRRPSILDAPRDVVLAARSAAGCLDFHLAADPTESDRINVYERWTRVDEVEAFRASGPSDEQQECVLGADVSQYEIAGIESLT